MTDNLQDLYPDPREIAHRTMLTGLEQLRSAAFRRELQELRQEVTELRAAKVELTLELRRVRDALERATGINYG